MSSSTDPLIKKTRVDYFANAGLLSKLSLWYIFPVLRKKEITVEDMQPNLAEHDAKSLGDELAKAYDESQRSKNSLLSALRKVYGNRLYAHGLLGFFREAIVRTIQLLLLGRFIRSFNDNDHGNTRFIFGGSLILTMLIYSFANIQYMYMSYRLSLKIRVAISELVYRKCLKVPQETIGTAGVGKITNFLASDVAMFLQACQFAHYAWIAPAVTLISAIVVWTYVGVAALAGISISLLLLPFQFYMSKWFGVLRSRTAASTDARLRLINEVLNGILFIKMSNWEEHFTELVGKARGAEMDLIRLRSMRVVTVNTLLQVSPRIALFATLVIFVLQGNQLDAETAFVTLALFNNVASLLTQRAPWAILYWTEALISTRRIDEFLRSEEMDTEGEKRGEDFVPGVHLERVSTKWSDGGGECLQGISLDLVPGKCVCLLGPVGAGKSTLLVTILGETTITSGSMKVEGSLAYTAQSPCLFSGTVRDNILFGHPYKPEWYDKVVAACALDRDFELLPFSDKTLVADKGVTLSGGQRARISLARAVYGDADIYLLDDPLSSVDALVGRHLSDHVIGGLLKTKCVILATHLTHHAQGASEVILLDKGTIVARGSYEELSQFDLAGAIPMDNVDDVVSDDEEMEESVKGGPSESSGPTAELEQGRKGTVGLGVVWEFLRAGNSIGAVTIFVVLNLLNQGTMTYADFYVKTWTEGDERTSPEQARSTTLYYVVVYSIMMVPLALLPFVTNVVHFGTCRRSSVKLHCNLFNGVVRAPMGFFERNAIGRMMNRFSKDMETVDITIADNFSRVIRRFLETVAIFVNICINMPILVLPSLIVSVIIFLLRKFYLRSASVVSRLEATNKSPVFSHVSATLHSLFTIRAYKAQDQFEAQFKSLQNAHSAVDFTRITIMWWFVNVIQFTTWLYFVVVTLSFMLVSADPAAVGLALSTAMNISGTFAAAFNQSAELENQLVSVERILEYTKLRAESGGGSRSAPDWPSHGGIQFHGARVSYIPGKDVLHGITCTFHPGEKVGIVGRTGAGKTTLVAALFRIVDLNSGMIHIDGLDICKVDRRDLRSKIAIIPQDPILFAGTLRKNLDPFGRYDDMRLVQAIADANLSGRVPQGLDTEVAENGTNFSHGERQLISIARALLKKSKILILDEATAHVDESMDAQIHNLVREKFEMCTVLTIAHRLGTILDSDRVCVMEAGGIVEFDSPATLLKSPESRLSEFMKKSKKNQLRE